MFKSDLKRCNECGEVFEATVDPEQDVDELPCPYLDCDGKGTVVKADLSDRWGQWIHKRVKTYIYWRGKVKVAVKNIYWRPVRKYNAAKRKFKRTAEWLRGSRSDSLREMAIQDLVDNHGYDREELEGMHYDHLYELIADEAYIQDGTVGESAVLEVDEEKDYCPNCHNENPEVMTKREGEYRCERCIMGGFN